MIGSARYWRETPQRYRYEAARCTDLLESRFFAPAGDDTRSPARQTADNG